MPGLESCGVGGLRRGVLHRTPHRGPHRGSSKGDPPPEGPSKGSCTGPHKGDPTKGPAKRPGSRPPWRPLPGAGRRWDEGWGPTALGPAAARGESRGALREVLSAGTARLRCSGCTTGFLSAGNRSWRSSRIAVGFVRQPVTPSSGTRRVRWDKLLLVPAGPWHLLLCPHLPSDGAEVARGGSRRWEGSCVPAEGVPAPGEGCER